MLFSHTGKGGMTCAIEQHPGRGHGTRPRHIEDGTPAECCVAGPGSCSPRRGRLVRKDIVMRLALRKRFACPACQNARSEGWSDSHWQGSRNYMGVFQSSVKNAGLPRENTYVFEMSRWQWRRNLDEAGALVSSAIGLLFDGAIGMGALLRMEFGDESFCGAHFVAAEGLIVESQSTDVCSGKHQHGALVPCGKSFCFQTDSDAMKAY